MSSVIGDDTRIAAADGPVVRNEDRREVAPVRISVIIPLFDKEPFIEAAVRSALDNGPGVFEVIVVDDGSRDRGADIVAAIDDPRINLIRKANGGVSSARNTGLDHATGDWIAFLDADDFWLPGFVDAIQTLIARYPQCAMVTTRYLSQDDDGRPYPGERGLVLRREPPAVARQFLWGDGAGSLLFHLLAGYPP